MSCVTITKIHFSFIFYQHKKIYYKRYLRYFNPCKKNLRLFCMRIRLYVINKIVVEEP